MTDPLTIWLRRFGRWYVDYIDAYPNKPTDKAIERWVEAHPLPEAQEAGEPKGWLPSNG